MYKNLDDNKAVMFWFEKFSWAVKHEDYFEGQEAQVHI